ncbi:MAG TPA: hypothetical protein VF865_11580 [Acidobacteriaceae bacterium]
MVKLRDDRATDVVGTPEGDGEFGPDQPLTPDAVEASASGLETPRGSAPAEYESDRHKPTGLEKVLDEVSHGTLQP